MSLSSTPSLQNFCLFKVIEQLEHYPHTLLSCLPPTLRRLLLVHLPVVDICQLADTCVFDGINAEEIWEQIYKQQVPQYFDWLEGFPACKQLIEAKKALEENDTTFRERYFSILAEILLNRERPSGYFAVQTDYGGFGFEAPPPSIIDRAPVDIVNTIIAGVKLQIDQPCFELLEAENAIEEGDKEEEEEEEETEPDLEEEYAKGNTVITAVSEYANEYQDRYLEIHCDHERGEHFMEVCVYKETNERYQYVPPRYSSYANDDNDYRLSDEDALTLLMDMCGFLPKYMTVSIAPFSSKKWSPDLLRKFLSDLVSLKLCFDVYVEGMKETEELLTAVLSNPKPVLSSLDLSSYPECDDIHEMCPVTDDHLLVFAKSCEIPSTLPPPVSPLCNLRELNLSYGRFSTSGLNDLATVIRSQHSLASFSLCSLLPAATGDYKYFYEVRREYYDYKLAEFCACGQPFVDALVGLFGSPSFQSVSLATVAFPQKLFQSLIAGFLGSSCTHSQVLKCEGIVLTDDGNESFESPQKSFTTPELSFQYKSLEISIREFERVPRFSTLLFSALPLRINSLKFFCCDHLYRRYTMNKKPYIAHDDCLPVATKNANFEVKSLSLCQPAGVSAEAIQTLLKNQELKSLELMFCNGVMDFTNIAGHLLKQLPTQSALEEIKISEGVNKENRYRPTPQPFSRESIKLFSDTLFSLPNLTRLTFEFSFDSFDRMGRNYHEFIKLMFESWKQMSGGRKFKKFVMHITFFGIGPEVQESLQLAGEMGLQVNSFASLGLQM